MSDANFYLTRLHELQADRADVARQMDELRGRLAAIDEAIAEAKQRLLEANMRTVEEKSAAPPEIP